MDIAKEMTFVHMRWHWPIFPLAVHVGSADVDKYCQGLNKKNM